MLSMYARVLRHVAVALGVVAVLAAGTSFGQDRQALLKGFDQLKANALQAIQQGKVSMVECRSAPRCPPRSG